MSYLDERFCRFVGRQIMVSEETLEDLCEDWDGEEDENGIINGEGNVVFDSHPYDEDDDEEMDEDEDDWDESDEWEVSASLRFEIENGMLTMVEPEVSIYGDPGLGEEAPEDTWNEDDEVSALEFLCLITGGENGGENKKPESQDECVDSDSRPWTREEATAWFKKWDAEAREAYKKVRGVDPFEKKEITR